MFQRRIPGTFVAHCMARHTLFAVVFACLFLAEGAWGEAVYTWVDENGVHHFAQQPPEDVDYEMKDIQVNLPTTPAPAPASGSTGSAASVNEQVDELLTAQEEARQKRQMSQAEKAAMAQNCQIAQANLVTVESRTRVMVPEADGTMRQLTDDERLAAVTQAQQDVEKFCQN